MASSPASGTCRLPGLERASRRARWEGRGWASVKSTRFADQAAWMRVQGPRRRTRTVVCSRAHQSVWHGRPRRGSAGSCRSACTRTRTRTRRPPPGPSRGPARSETGWKGLLVCLSYSNRAVRRRLSTRTMRAREWPCSGRRPARFLVSQPRRKQARRRFSALMCL